MVIADDDDDVDNNSSFSDDEAIVANQLSCSPDVTCSKNSKKDV